MKNTDHLTQLPDIFAHKISRVRKPVSQLGGYCSEVNAPNCSLAECNGTV